jgi:hypothetical protein
MWEAMLGESNNQRKNGCKHENPKNSVFKLFNDKLPEVLDPRDPLSVRTILLFTGLQLVWGSKDSILLVGSQLVSKALVASHFRRELVQTLANFLSLGVILDVIRMKEVTEIFL